MSPTAAPRQTALVRTTATTLGTTEPGTNGTAGAGRIAAAFAAAHADGRAALIPYVVAGYPDAETSVEIALAAADAGADLLAARVLASAQRALRRRAPGPAARPDGLRQPGSRWR